MDPKNQKQWTSGPWEQDVDRTMYQRRKYYFILESARPDKKLPVIYCSLETHKQ